MNNLKRKVLFTVNSGAVPWCNHEVESDTIDESQLLSWCKDCVVHHTGRALTKMEWMIFKTNHKLIRVNGNLKYEFEYSPFSIE